MSSECDKHSECMERIHNEVNDIKNEVSRSAGIAEGFNKTVKEFLETIRKDIYAPGGMVERVGNHSFQLVLQWCILGAVITGVIIDYFKR